MNRNRFQKTALLAALLAIVRPSPARADGCGEVADGILKPLIARVEACAAGKEEYEQHLAAAVKAQHDWIANLGKAKDVLAKEGQRLIDAWNKEIPLAAEAIAEIKKRVATEVEGAYKEEKRLRGLKDDYGADLCIKNAQALELSVTEKRASGFKKELGMLETILGFEKFMEDRRKKIVDLQALIADGKFGMIIIKEIARGADLNTIEQLEVDAKALITKLETGEQAYGLKAVGRAATRQESADMSKAAEAELAATRTRIRDGEQYVNLPPLGNITRNGLQKLIAETTEAKYAIEDAWESASYAAMNKVLRRNVTLRELKSLHTRYTAASIMADRDAGERKGAEEQLAEINKAIEEHQRMYDDAVAAKKKRLDEITPLLPKTPCRLGKLLGEDPDQAALKRGREMIAKGMSENEAEERDRLARHGDRIYVEEDSTIHGSLQDALANATSDLGLPASPEQPGFWDVLTEFENLADRLSSLKGVDEIEVATRKVAAFVRTLKALDPNAPDLVERQLEILKTAGPEIADLFEKGYLSPTMLEKSISVLVETGKHPDALKELRKLQVKANVLWKSGIAGVLRRSMPKGVSAAKVLHEARAVIDGLPAATVQTWQKMSAFDKTCTILSTLSAAGTFVDLTTKGTDPKEAAARAVTNFAVDFAVGGFPPTAALELASLLVFHSLAYVTSEKAWSQAVFSDVVKSGFEAFYDKVAEAATAAGAAGERALTDEVLRNVSLKRLHRSVGVAEGRLAALKPGDAAEPSLLRMRERIRKAIRAVEKR